MSNIGDLVREADWKLEKHVPVIDGPDAVAADELFKVTVGIGKVIAHPNTTAHHISWISLFFQPEGEKLLYDIGHYAFKAHGASVNGPNTSTVYTHHQVTTALKTSKPGTLIALALCNIHGLWQSAKEIQLT